MSSRTIAKSKNRPPAVKPRAADQPDTHKSQKQLYIAIAVLTVTVVAVFANSLANGFVFDDKPIILDNRLLRHLSNLLIVLRSSYRPLRDISHMFDFALWGENPVGFHVTNILIHLANTLLVFTLVRRMAGDLIVALIAAFIFAVNPIQIDSVTYISGRRDVLFSFFYLISFHCYLTYQAQRSYRYLAFFLGAWVLSLMSKEMAASLPGFIFIWNFCDVWNEQTGSWLRRLWGALKTAFLRDRWLYLGLIAATIIYAWYMIFVRGASILARDGFKYWGGSFYTNMLLAVRVQAWYLKQLIWPTPTIQYKGAFDISTTILDWRVLVSLVAVIAALAAGFFALKRNRLIAFAIMSYFVLLSPVAQIIPHHELLADHYLYLPMMSFGLLVGLVVQQLAQRSASVQKAAYAVIALAIVALATMTVLRNPVYKDDLSLWQANYQEVPNSIRSTSSLAKAIATSNPGKADDLYRRCLAIDPSYGPAYYSLASLNRSRDKALEVEGMIRKGLTLTDAQISASGTQDPPMFRSQLTVALAMTKRSEGDEDSAEQLYKDAIRIYPYNPEPYTALANMYRERDPDKALASLKQLAGAYPTSRQPLEQLASLLMDEKRYDEAIPYLEKLLRLIPNDYTANLQLSRVYSGKNDCAHARSYLNAAKIAAVSDKEQRDAKKAESDLNQDCGGR